MSNLCSREYLNKKQILIFGLSFLPLLVTLFVYGKLPDQIPTNFGADGYVSYEDKNHIWLIAGMAPLMGLLFYVLPAIDPKRSNYAKFWSVYQGFQIVLQLFLLAMFLIILTETFRPGTVSVPTVVLAMCGVLFMVLGNMMPKFRQNFFCGFRTPWALTNEQVWNKTHRLGGKLFVFAGLTGFLGAFVPDDNWKLALFLIPALAACFVPYVMSYVWFRQIMNGKM